MQTIPAGGRGNQSHLFLCYYRELQKKHCGPSSMLINTQECFFFPDFEDCLWSFVPSFWLMAMGSENKHEVTEKGMIYCRFFAGFEAGLSFLHGYMAQTKNSKPSGDSTYYSCLLHKQMPKHDHCVYFWHVTCCWQHKSLNRCVCRMNEDMTWINDSSWTQAIILKATVAHWGWVGGCVDLYMATS